MRIGCHHGDIVAINIEEHTIHYRTKFVVGSAEKRFYNTVGQKINIHCQNTGIFLQFGETWIFVAILTNKIVAVLNRDEEKDIFDLFAISYNESFNWGTVLEIANKKALVDRGFLIERLNEFPLEWLSHLKIVKSIDIKKEAISRLCEDILNETENSLYCA